MTTDQIARDRLWSITETSAYLDIPVWTLRAWASRGKGPRSYKVGRHRKYKPADVEKWLQTVASDPGAV